MLAVAAVVATMVGATAALDCYTQKGTVATPLPEGASLTMNSATTLVASHTTAAPMLQVQVLAMIIASHTRGTLVATTVAAAVVVVVVVGWNNDNGITCSNGEMHCITNAHPPPP
jgi:hypothetical protein